MLVGETQEFVRRNSEPSTALQAGETTEEKVKTPVIASSLGKHKFLVVKSS